MLLMKYILRVLRTRGRVFCEKKDVNTFRMMVLKLHHPFIVVTPYLTGWHETMTIVIYRVDIKYAANVLGEGILRPLLLKADTGEADDTVWDFPAVRAVIDFKWTHWARRYLIAEFLLYLGWLLCFVGFMTIYIEKNLDKSFHHHMDGGDMTFALIAYVLDAGSLLFMCPFLAIDYNTIHYYKWQWLSMWNVLDSLAYILQFLVSVLHFTHTEFKSKFYVTLLAAQCTLLFIKVQYFARYVCELSFRDYHDRCFAG